MKTTTWHRTQTKSSENGKTFRTSFIVSTKASDSNPYQQELTNRQNYKNKSQIRNAECATLRQKQHPIHSVDAARFPKAFTKLDTIECCGRSTTTFYRNTVSKRVTTKNPGRCKEYQQLSWETQTPRFYERLPFNWRVLQKMVPTRLIQPYWISKASQGC